ncbi:MAG: hypothetical protein LBH92_07650 [Bacteroidales bacterium]|nr:hypothetical protein [Bacteroidales bacterium]
MATRNLFFLVSVFIFALSSCNDKKSREFPLSELEEGDILFRKGNGGKTRTVLMADTEGIYSHVGIVVVTDSGFMAVHITPGERHSEETEDYIKMERLEHFFSPKLASQGAFMRLQDSSCAPRKAAKYAIAFYEERIIFDNDYNLGDPSKMYCTELIWRVFQLAGKDITNGRRSFVRGFPLYSGEYIFPSDISKNEQLIEYYRF